MFKLIVNVLILLIVCIGLYNINCSNIIESSTLQIISRNEWKADPPSANVDDVESPTGIVIIIHTASSFCNNQVECISSVKSIQNYHMNSQKFNDIGYNFLIGSDGLIYEGRGWDKEGAHTIGYNKISLGIAFIGNYMEIEPTKAQLNAIQALLLKGIELKKLSPNYKLYGHRQLRPTLSPGDALYRIIKNWEHWTEHIVIKE